MSPRHPATAPRCGRLLLIGLTTCIGPDHLRELSYLDRKALHNFKYFTWVEQQGRTSDDLRKLWAPDLWTEQFGQAAEWDRAIMEFNLRAKA